MIHEQLHWSVSLAIWIGIITILLAIIWTLKFRRKKGV
ncbi:MAG: LPXTG cell wall anchor domain-containing protein [Promethearchaeota archaeon]|nr:MAG: LPXTG cell wall anchor domain-containing protein [Candidatus Lokiarchaeota archaeon]